MTYIKVIVLGCSGTYPESGGACSGYLIDTGETNVWLEAGPGTLPNFLLHQQIENLDALVISHEHIDHWLELPVIYNALKYGLNVSVGREGGNAKKSSPDPLPVYGTAGTLGALESLMQKSLFPVIDFRVVADGDEVEIGNQSWRFCQTDHSVETLASRVSVKTDAGSVKTDGVSVKTDGVSVKTDAGLNNGNGSSDEIDEVSEISVAYSADTGVDWNPESVTDGADLFLCEATFASSANSAFNFNNSSTTNGLSSGSQHLTARQAGELAKRGGAKRLVLTHRRPNTNGSEVGGGTGTGTAGGNEDGSELEDASEIENSSEIEDVNEVKSEDTYFKEASEAFGSPVELAEVNAVYNIVSTMS